MGLGVDGEKMDRQKSQDQMAKTGMRSIAGQLLKLLPASPTGVDQQIAELCNFIIGAKKKFNRKGNSLKARISAILTALNPNAQGSGNQSGGNQSGGNQSGGNQSGGNQGTGGAQNQPAAPAVEKLPEKKKFLTMLLAMESSRLISKSGAADARQDVIFDAISSVGSLTGLLSSVTSALGDGMTGLILNAVATGIGLIGTGRDTAGLVGSFGAKGQRDRNKERNKKVKACTSAVEQMAALPALNLDEVRAAERNNLPMNVTKMESAEQYAAVFSIVQAANVNMLDFLYAVSKGNFGGQNGNLQESLKGMFMNLEFTN